MIIRARITVGGKHEGLHELAKINDIIVWRYLAFTDDIVTMTLSIEHRNYLPLYNSKYNLPFKESDLDKLV